MLSPRSGRRRVGNPGAVGCLAPLSAPSSGTRRHLHTFRLARCSPFRPPRFQLLIWKRKKKPAGRGRPQGGNWSRSTARAPPARCRVPATLRPPRARPPPRPAPRVRPAPPSQGRSPGDLGDLRARSGGPAAVGEGAPGRGGGEARGLRPGRSPPEPLPGSPSRCRGAPPGVLLLCVPR